MAHVTPRGDPVELDEPTLIEGLPGIGLVGKIATDHVVDELGMDYHASVHCDGLPPIGVYRKGQSAVQPPVRIYADADRGLLALQSDVPVSASAATEFASCLSGWLEEQSATPVYLSGKPAEKNGVPALYGVATGGGASWLDGIDAGTPSEDGAIGGPTGALLNVAAEHDRDAVALIVESDPQFPDPEAARVLIEKGIEPLTGVDVGVEDLVERAEEIRQQKEQLARKMREAETDESSQAQPLRMFQ